MMNRKFKKGDRVRVTKAARKRFRKSLQKSVPHLPADGGRLLDDVDRQISGTGKVARVDNLEGRPCVHVVFPKYGRELPCSPEDLEQA